MYGIGAYESIGIEFNSKVNGVGVLSVTYVRQRGKRRLGALDESGPTGWSGVGSVKTGNNCGKLYGSL